MDKCNSTNNKHFTENSMSISICAVVYPTEVFIYNCQKLYTKTFIEAIILIVPCYKQTNFLKNNQQIVSNSFSGRLQSNGNEQITVNYSDKSHNYKYRKASSNFD
jgi:hypothetical protein